MDVGQLAASIIAKHEISKDVTEESVRSYVDIEIWIEEIRVTSEVREEIIQAVMKLLNQPTPPGAGSRLQHL